MTHFERAARRGSLLFLFLIGCLAAPAQGQQPLPQPTQQQQLLPPLPPQGGAERARAVAEKWERVYSEPGGAAGFKAVFLPDASDFSSSPHWLLLGDDKGGLRFAPLDPKSHAWLGPPLLSSAPHFSLGRPEPGTGNVTDAHSRAAPINAIHFNGEGRGYLLKGNRLFSTDNGGFNWSLNYQVQDLPDRSQATLYSIAVTNKGACMVGMYGTADEVRDSLVYCTKGAPNEGARWERIKVEPDTQLFHIFFHDDNLGWIVGAQGTILRTENGGQDWEPVSVEAHSLFQSYFVNERDGWAVGRYGTILRTRDGGVQWEPVKSRISLNLSTISLRSIKFSKDKKSAWIVGDQGTILHSSDGGESWDQVPPPQPVDLRLEAPAKEIRLEALFVDDKYCWAVGSGGTVWRQKVK